MVIYMIYYIILSIIYKVNAIYTTKHMIILNSPLNQQTIVE